MGALDGEIWVCAECRSINNAGARQCYNCRTPRDLAAVDPSTIQGTGHGKLRDVALPPFSSPRPYAVVASILILAIAGLQIVYTLDFTTLILQTLDGTPATAEQLRFIGTIGLVTLAVGIVALVGWSLWLSRAVTAMPALGLGYPAANGLTAFVENFLPGLNLVRVPAIVRDVVKRVDPGPNRGEALIFAAWIGLLGGFVVPRAFAIINGFSADSETSALRSQLTIQGISVGLVLIGAIFLVALIWWIEERIDRRREAQLAGIDGATEGSAGEHVEPTEGGVSVPYATPPPAAAQVAPQPAFAAEAASPQEAAAPAPPAGSAWAWRDTSDSPLAGDAASASALAAAGWDTEVDIPVAPRPSIESAPIVGPGGVVKPMELVESPAVDGPAPVATPALPEPTAVPPVPAVPPEPAEPAAEIPASMVESVEPAQPIEAASESPEPARPVEAARAPSNGGGPPHLTIRIENHGMLQAEMEGEQEPVILDDLTAYGSALAEVGGTAEIVITGSDSMADLIARRAQRIMADAGIDASLAD